jgi:hypothetical protein
MRLLVDTHLLLWAAAKSDVVKVVQQRPREGRRNR